MVKIYARANFAFKQYEISSLESISKTDIIWIDLLNPTVSDIKKISTAFGVEFPNEQERESIESSYRYWEDTEAIAINALFMISFFFAGKEKESCNESVAFIIKNGILFTLRYKDLKSFDEVQKRVLTASVEISNGYDIFLQIFDHRIELDADLIEYAAKEINKLRKDIFSTSTSKLSDDEILEKISTIQEFNLKVRESISDKRRIAIGLLKSNKIAKKQRDDLTIMIKDISSLIEFTTINLNALDNIQNLFIGQINIDQNKIIKLFTVVNVVLMPPTLIASIYGMNFEILPELKWEYGYLYSLILMALSSIVPFVYFKRKGWF